MKITLTHLDYLLRISCIVTIAWIIVILVHVQTIGNEVKKDESIEITNQKIIMDLQSTIRNSQIIGRSNQMISLKNQADMLDILKNQSK